MFDFFFARKHAWIGLVIIVIGGFSCAAGLTRLTEARDLANMGVMTTATIYERFTQVESCRSDFEASEFNRDNCTETVEYGRFVFEINSQAYGGDARIGNPERDLHPENTLQVTYLPSNPNVFEHKFAPLQKRGLGDLIPGLAMILLGALVFWAKGGMAYFDRFPAKKV